METELLGVGFDFYWQPPPHLMLDTHDSMYASYREDSSSPDGANSCSTTAAVPTAPPSSPPHNPAASKNMVMERDRRRRLNEKLYALRSVVPNITKMDKASIIRDAIAYIERLQEEERRMLAEVSTLESSSAVKAEDADRFPLRKKLRRASPDDGAASAAPPVQILEVHVSEAAGENVSVVSVRCSRARDAVAKVCRALEPLRLRVVTATIAAVGDAVVHTMFVQTTEEMGGAQLKDTVQAALAKLDVTGRSLKPIRFWDF